MKEGHSGRRWTGEEKRIFKNEKRINGRENKRRKKIKICRPQMKGSTEKTGWWRKEKRRREKKTGQRKRSEGKLKTADDGTEAEEDD